MNSDRLRALLLGSAGFAVLLLLGVANSSSPTEATREPAPRTTVVLGPEDPVTGVNPFRTPMKPIKPKVDAPVEQALPPAVEPLPGVVAEPLKVEMPNPEPIPDLKVEGVVMGADPVAVIHLGSESYVIRVGESFGDGFKILSISDSEVRVKRLGKEFVLRTGG